MAEDRALADEVGVKVGDDEVVRRGGLGGGDGGHASHSGRRVQRLLGGEFARLAPASTGDPEVMACGGLNRFITQATGFSIGKVQHDIVGEFASLDVVGKHTVTRLDALHRDQSAFRPNRRSCRQTTPSPRSRRWEDYFN